jgi:hypothetical protein
LQNKYLNGLPVGDMLGIMGNGGNGGNETRGTVGLSPPGAGGSAAVGNANNANGGNFSLGNILRMFTGGGNANRPPPAQTNPPPQSSQSNPRPPVIIPPVPAAPTSIPARVAPNGQVPIASRPVPPSGLAATLPPMNVRGMNPSAAASNPPSGDPNHAPQRRMLRRPSPHLRDADQPMNPHRVPLSPVQESTHERDLPSPP